MFGAGLLFWLHVLWRTPWVGEHTFSFNRRARQLVCLWLVPILLTSQQVTCLSTCSVFIASFADVVYCQFYTYNNTPINTSSWSNVGRFLWFCEQYLYDLCFSDFPHFLKFLQMFSLSFFTFCHVFLLILSLLRQAFFFSHRISNDGY
jgi:hypothetical protein